MYKPHNRYRSHGKLSTWTQPKCLICKRFLSTKKKAGYKIYCPSCKLKKTRMREKELYHLKHPNALFRHFKGRKVNRFEEEREI